MRAVFLFIGFLISNLALAQIGTSGVLVTGEASRQLEPDQLRIDIVVSAEAKEPAEAQKKIMDDSRAIIAFLKEISAVSELHTEHVRLFPRTDPRNGEISYRADQSLGFLLKDLTAYDELMLALLEKGVTGIQRMNFEASSAEAIEQELLQLALINARDKARLMAHTLNRGLGEAEYISDRRYGNGIMPYASDGLRFSSSSSSLAEGMIELRVEVVVNFKLN